MPPPSPRFLQSRRKLLSPRAGPSLEPGDGGDGEGGARHVAFKLEAGAAEATQAEAGGEGWAANAERKALR